MRGVVASGHPLTTQAGLDMLQMGGNAFDAAIAAAFAATVTEPCLTSLGGGGFMLTHQAGKHKSRLLDFFVDSSGKGGRTNKQPHQIPIDVHFVSTVQEFHAGEGSIAVPGMLKGLLYAHETLGTIDIKDIIAPTIKYLTQGVPISRFQEYLSRILRPILSLSKYGERIFDPNTKLYKNPKYLDFLKSGDAQSWDNAIYGSGAAELSGAISDAGGILSERDLREYRVIEREPLSFKFKGNTIFSNPAPSLGGALYEAGLGMLEAQYTSAMPEQERYVMLADIMSSINQMKGGTTGTTHISVIDSTGNAASITSSNGSNSGVYAGDTGVMLNNMMGEDDLHPDGFHKMVPGRRVGSMMSPAIIMKGEQVVAALGSGGSKRIKTAILQATHNFIDLGMSAKDAVEASRIHLDDENELQVEPGLGEEVISSLKQHYILNVWANKDLYFGGVNMVTSSMQGWGDSRRGGYCKAV